ncbi:hypothetical protein BDF21DRAFT_462374, partial [Thamnidium elegans]
MVYLISVYRSNKKIAPIVVTFVISSMKYNVSKKTTCNKNLPFLLKYPSDPWARSCYFVTDSSIISSLTSPLTPFVALSEFLIDQHPSFLSNPFYTDSNIQQLYSNASNIFQDQIVKNKDYLEKLVKVCKGSEAIMSEAIETLSEEVPDMKMWPKTKKVLEDAKLLSQANKRKYQAVSDADEADDTNSNTNSNTNINTNINTYTNNNLIYTPENENENWAYIDSVRKHYDDKIDWEACFQVGK